MNIIEAYKQIKLGNKVKRNGWKIYYKASEYGYSVDMYNCCDNSLVDVYELDDPADVLDVYKTFISIDDVLADDWEVIDG